jgi:hypothetical protein
MPSRGFPSRRPRVRTKASACPVPRTRSAKVRPVGLRPELQLSAVCIHEPQYAVVALSKSPTTRPVLSIRRQRRAPSAAEPDVGHAVVRRPRPAARCRCRPADVSPRGNGAMSVSLRRLSGTSWSVCDPSVVSPLPGTAVRVPAGSIRPAVPLTASALRPGGLRRGRMERSHPLMTIRG